MKTASKLIALLLTVVFLTMAFSGSVFADDPVTYTITVTNAKEGANYSIYKMLDLTINADHTKYSYTVADGWADFFDPDTGAAKDYVTVTDGVVTWKDGVSTDSATIVQEFAKKAKAYADKKGLTPVTKTPAAGTTSVLFDALEAGYYLVTSTAGTRVMVDTTPDSKEVVINEKNVTPSIDKKVKEDSTGKYEGTNDASIGDDVDFRVTVTIAAGALNYMMSDTLSAGLTFKEDSVVVGLDTDDDGEIDTAWTDEGENPDFTVSKTDDQHFTVTFTQAKVEAANVGEKILVFYQATLNGNAYSPATGCVVSENEVKLQYGNEPKLWTEPSKTETRTYGFEIVKTDGDDKLNELVQTATFMLSEDSEGLHPYRLVEIAVGDYRLATAEDESTTTTIRLDANNRAKISGLDDEDSYYLNEVNVPDGFNKMLTQEVKMPVDNSNYVVGTLIKGDTYTEANKGVQVINKSGTELPSTGGIGTTIFYVAGGLMAALAVIILVVRKRMSIEEAD